VEEVGELAEDLVPHLPGWTRLLAVLEQVREAALAA
jgi:hypothetical protein